MGLYSVVNDEVIPLGRGAPAQGGEMVHPPGGSWANDQISSNQID